MEGLLQAGSSYFYYKFGDALRARGSSAQSITLWTSFGILLNI
ncbi:hypothetical protein ERO13_A05G128749v2 [Gossypium hirsutum]|nr:hypothetical protein ERO13_A05G128749v2 [Gossypium hirsutum]